MSLRLRLALQGDLEGLAHRAHLAIARGARNAVETMQARAKIKLRSDVMQGGLGERVANAWRAEIYPKSAAKRSHSPAVLVWTKAPLIVEAFESGAAIKAKNGSTYLAIPTQHVPRKKNKRMTPNQVEDHFNADLYFVKRKGSNTMLAFLNVIRGKNGKGFRAATKRRRAAGRTVENILMFVLVRQVHLRKKLNARRIFADLEEEWAELFPSEIAKSLNAGV